MKFIAKGSLFLEGVTFHVEAPDLKTARLRLGAGLYDSYETDEAEATDAHISPTSIEENV